MRENAKYVLWLLIAVNVLNYIDRYALYSFLPLVQKDLRITDAQAGALASAFMVVYMVASLPLAYLADRFGRPPLMAAGLAVWSLATGLSSLASRYLPLLGARALVGAGESCYVAASPSFVAEHFPAGQRGSVLGLFLMTIPMGAALGFMIGSNAAQEWGWKNAFWVIGLPGLLLVAPLWRLRDPRDAAARIHSQAPTRPSPAPLDWRGFAEIFKTPSYLAATLTSAALTFALGGMGVWMSSFFHRNWGMSVGHAGTMLGGATATTGALGTLAGGWIADRLDGRFKAPYFLVSGLSVLIGAPLVAASLWAPDLRWAILLFYISDFFIFMHIGPLNAVIVSVTDPRYRSLAFAANIFIIHALGDAVSPTAIGFASDHLGLKSALLFSTLGFWAAAAISLAAMGRYQSDALYAS